MDPSYATQWAAHYAAQAARGKGGEEEVSGPSHQEQVVRIRDELMTDMLSKLKAGGEGAASICASFGEDKVCAIQKYNLVADVVHITGARRAAV